MPMQVCTADAGEVIYAAVTGDLDPIAGRELYRALVEDYADRGMSGMLFDCRGLTGPLSAMQRYGLGVFIAETNQERFRGGAVPPRLAIVAREPLFDPGTFLETVAVNRGVELHSTTSLLGAAAWLQLDPELLPEWVERE
jgi:hypothetical protein